MKYNMPILNQQWSSQWEQIWLVLYPEKYLKLVQSPVLQAVGI